MKKLFLISVLFLVVTACGTTGTRSAPTPTPPPTATPLPPTETPIPTPTVETGPEGTIVKTDYMNNKYSVDAQGMPTYWFNSETNQWETFQPIDFKPGYQENPNHPTVPHIVYITSGYMKEVVMNQVESGLWEPRSPDAFYMDNNNWEQSFLDSFDPSGARLAMPSLTLYQTEIKTTERYSIQPTSLSFFVPHERQNFEVITEILLIQAEDGSKQQIPLFFYFPESIWNNEAYDDYHGYPLFKLLYFQENVALPIIENDFGMADDWYNNHLLPNQKQTFKDFRDFYKYDANLPSFEARKKLLDSLIRGNLSATDLNNLSIYLQAPYISQAIVIP